MVPRRLLAMLAPVVVACGAAAAQGQKTQQRLDTAVLVDAPVVPQMVVDSDGTLHFGPREATATPVPATRLDGRAPRRR
jgi:hypothetical protein